MHKYRGSLIMEIGPMFGGKTSALLANVRKMKIAGYKIFLFKIKKDDRYSVHEIVTHDGDKISAINIETLDDIEDYLQIYTDINVIAIDEIQFLNTNKQELTSFVLGCLKKGVTVIASGLDLDSDLVPFEHVETLLPYSQYINKHKAVCVKCGNDATTSYCKVEKSTKELLGGQETYEPRCLQCYFKGDKA